MGGADRRARPDRALHSLAATRARRLAAFAARSRRARTHIAEATLGVVDRAWKDPLGPRALAWADASTSTARQYVRVAARKHRSRDRDARSHAPRPRAADRQSHRRRGDRR